MSAAGEKIIAGLEQAVAHSKGPQFTKELEMRVSSLPSANNSFHLYLADKRGRKVAALWGGSAEKMANGYLWSANPDGPAAATVINDLFEAAQVAMSAIRPLVDQGEDRIWRPATRAMDALSAALNKASQS